jgi:hypothetical protein
MGRSQFPQLYQHLSYLMLDNTLVIVVFYERLPKSVLEFEGLLFERS